MYVFYEDKENITINEVETPVFKKIVVEKGNTVEIVNKSEKEIFEILEAPEGYTFNCAYYNSKNENVETRVNIENEIILLNKMNEKFLFEVNNGDGKDFILCIPYDGITSISWTQKVKLFYAALLASNSH